MKKLISGFIVFLLTVALAQTQTIAPLFSMQYHCGYVWAHTKKMNHLVLDHLQGIEGNILLNPDGSKRWHHDYHFPETGISITMLNLSNDERLGYVFGIYPFINFPLKKTSHWKIFLRGGAGLGIATKYYDRLENYKNIAIGSPLNAFINFRIENRFKIFEKLSANISLGLTHFSNGAFSMPNLGINIPTLSTGIIWTPSTKKEIVKFKDTLIHEKKYEFNFFVSTGIKEGMPVGGPKQIYVSSNSEALVRLNNTQQIGVGLDICFDESYLFDLKESSLINSNIENTQLGLGFLHNLTMSRFNFLFEMGYYLYSKHTGDGVFYHRIALRYRIFNRIYGSLCLKSHFARANNIDVGIGIKL